MIIIAKNSVNVVCYLSVVYMYGVPNVLHFAMYRLTIFKLYVSSYHFNGNIICLYKLQVTSPESEWARPPIGMLIRLK